ncbi:MAG: hypothetical protein NTY35_03220 [Planctomycetota bacterium]|nr:hypothetical protein [Planctomycetota bacterium]
MKIYIAFLPAFLALSVAPAMAFTANDTPAPTTTPAKVDIRVRFNAMCDELAQKAAARKATRADFAKVVDEMRNIANEYVDNARAITMRDKMIERMNALEVKARDASLQLMEFDVFKDLIIDLELDSLLLRVSSLAREGKATRLEWLMVTTALTQRAEAAKAWNPEIDAIVGRLLAECGRLEKRAGEALKPADLAPLQGLHADVMVHAAAARLTKRAIEPIPGVIDPKGRYLLVTRDFDDVKDGLLATGVPATADLMRKVGARLDVIRDAAIGGRITRADCDALCTLLLERARAAVTPG